MSRLIATVVALGTLGVGGVAVLDFQRQGVASQTATATENQSLALLDGISQTVTGVALPGAILILGAVLIGVALFMLGGPR